MNLLGRVSLSCLLLWPATLLAQLTLSPVLTQPPHIQYPPIARAAHIEGVVVVSFSIDSDGRTISVKTVSGPLMLTWGVEEQIKQWTFKIPLSVIAQHDFLATYKFGLHSDDENLDDDLDAPPYYPCCGDVITLSASAAQIKGEVQSTDGTQSIDVTPAPPEPPKDSCPDDKEKQPPASTTAADFVELYRTSCTLNCRNYRVRLYRDGRVEWHGKENVAVKGDLNAQILPDAAASLLTRLQASDFWTACSVTTPSPDQDVDAEDFYRFDYLTVSLDGHIKSVDTNTFPAGEKLAWSVDKTANTHRWRHGDSLSEPYTNMDDDLQLPKPGITALIRSTYRFSSTNAQQTLEPLKYLIASSVDIDAADESGWTALMYAAELSPDNNPELKLLVDAHADINRSSLHGDTALMMAAYKGNLEEILLNKGAQINAGNADGVTVLMLLAQHGDADTLKEARDAGADPTMRDNAGHTALDYLLAASCQKPFIPLPKPWMQIISKEPPPCPSTNEEFLRSQSILKAAMRQTDLHSHNEP